MGCVHKIKFVQQLIIFLNFRTSNYSRNLTLKVSPHEWLKSSQLLRVRLKMQSTAEVSKFADQECTRNFKLNLFPEISDLEKIIDVNANFLSSNSLSSAVMYQNWWNYSLLCRSIQQQNNCKIAKLPWHHNINLLFSLFVFLSFCLFVFLSFCFFVFLSFCPFVKKHILQKVVKNCKKVETKLEKS